MIEISPLLIVPSIVKFLIELISFWASRINALLAAPCPNVTLSKAIISDSLIMVLPTLILFAPVVIVSAINSVTVTVPNPERSLLASGINTLLARAVPSVIPDNWSSSAPVTVSPVNLLISVAAAVTAVPSNLSVFASISPEDP